MRKLIKNILLTVCIIAVLYFVFLGLGKLVSDYSIEGLKLAVERSSVVDLLSLPEQRLYQEYIQDLQVYELTQVNPDFEKLAVLGTTSRDLENGEVRGRGIADLDFYLQRAAAIQGKQKATLDLGYSMDVLIHQGIQEASAFFRSSWNKLSGRGQEKPSARVSMEKTLYEKVLAEENRGDLEAASQIYLRYLETEAEISDRGFVMLSLARLRLKQQKLDEAASILGEVRRNYIGRSEARFAVVMKRQLEEVKAAQGKIRETIGRFPQGDISQASEAERVELAKLFLKTYRSKDAGEVLGGLLQSTSLEVADSARFYLGWIYKIENKLDQSAVMFKDLLNRKYIREDYRREIHSELADTYYKMNEKEKAIEQYQHIVASYGGAPDGAKGTWASLAELETAKIYYFDLKDIKSSFSHLQGLEEGSDFSARAAQELRGIGQERLRAEAFIALQAGKLTAAQELFEQSFQLDSRDGRALAGLASIALLMGDSERSLTLARQAYDIKPDQYTSATLAYVYQAIGNYQEAVENYQRSIGSDKDYMAARYNLAYCYLILKKYKKALKTLDEINVKADSVPGFVKSKILNNKGCAMWGLGKYAEAKSKFEEALKVTPNFELAEENLKLNAPGQSAQVAGDETIR